MVREGDLLLKKNYSASKKLRKPQLEQEKGADLVGDKGSVFA